MSESELTQRLWAAVRTAVERSVLGASRVAVALGGTDSSAILAALCELRPASEIVAYTFDYDRGADVPFARELCEAYGVSLNILRVEDLPTDLAPGLVVDGLPFWCLPGAHEVHVQSMLARDGIDRVLTGSYGDDIFGGQWSLLAGSFLERPIGTVGKLRRLRTAFPIALPRRLRSAIVGPLLHQIMPASIHRERIRRALRKRAPWLSAQVFELAAAGIDATARAYLAPTNPSAWRAELRRRISRGHGPRTQVVVQGGVSRADPFLETQLLSFVAAIPYERLCLGDEYRGLFRRSLPHRVPASVRHRESKAGPADDLRRYGAAGDASLRPFVSVERLAKLGFVDPVAFLRGYDTLGTSTPFVWSVLSAEAFLREVS